MSERKPKSKETIPAGGASRDEERVEPARATVPDATPDGRPEPGFGAISVVIPHFRGKDGGESLRLALRSWERNFKEPHAIVVIGEREEWIDEERVTFIGMERPSDNPNVCLMEAMKAAIAAGEVTDAFVFATDDVYLVAPVGMAHIDLPKSVGRLTASSTDASVRADTERTLTLLRERGLPLVSYETGLPALYRKERLVTLLEEVPEACDGRLLLASFYMGAWNISRPYPLDWRSDPFLLPVVTATPDPTRFDELLGKKLFLRHSADGYSPFLAGRLREMFPEASACEKARERETGNGT
ncbi:MAG: hypothetical protein LBN29_11425 [Mediterranea sp.]|jgi:hypothetical protein|nr:hypothetical protein [Mediterranea sp.]